MFSTIAHGLKSLFFPNNCYCCHHHLNSQCHEQLCPACLEKIQLATPPFERAAGAAFDRSWYACIYEEPLRALLHQFKYQGKTALRHTFCHLLINCIDTYHLPVGDMDLIVPIPLHPTRLRERGYNQSLLLAHGLAQHYKIHLLDNVLLRTQHTKPQAHLDQKQRWTNLGTAFKINPSSKVADKSILIVDDLLTTGATASSAAAALKDAGAAYVSVLTLAAAR